MSQSSVRPTTGSIPVWPQSLLFACVVLAGILSGRMDSAGGLDLALGIGILTAAIVSPILGVAALIAACIASPLSLPTGTETDLHLPLVLVPGLAVVWLARAFGMSRPPLLRLKPIQALMALVATAIVAFVAANLPGDGYGVHAPVQAQLGGIYVFVVSACVFVLAVSWLRDVASISRITWLFLILSAAATSGLMMPELRPVGDFLLQPGADGSLLWTWMVGLACGQAAYNRELDWRWRTLLTFLVLVALYTGLWGHPAWMSGWLPPCVAAVVALGAGVSRINRKLLAVAAVGSALVVPLVVRGGFLGDNLYSLGTRFDAWQILGRIIASSPILGLGPSNYYYVTPMFPIRGFAVSFSSHNQYIDLLAQTGAIGLLCFLWFAWEIGRVGWRLRSRVSSGFARGYVLGALGGLAGTLVAGLLGDWVLPFVYNVTLTGLRASLFAWLFLGALLALEQITERSGSSSRHSPPSRARPSDS